jgi:hypothetical protein
LNSPTLESETASREAQRDYNGRDTGCKCKAPPRGPLFRHPADRPPTVAAGAGRTPSAASWDFAHHRLYCRREYHVSYCC